MKIIKRKSIIRFVINDPKNLWIHIFKTIGYKNIQKTLLQKVKKHKKFNLFYFSEKKSDHSNRICVEKGKNNTLM